MCLPAVQGKAGALRLPGVYQWHDGEPQSSDGLARQHSVEWAKIVGPVFFDLNYHSGEVNEHCCDPVRIMVFLPENDRRFGPLMLFQGRIVMDELKGFLRTSGLLLLLNSFPPPSSYR